MPWIHLIISVCFSWLNDKRAPFTCSSCKTNAYTKTLPWDVSAMGVPLQTEADIQQEALPNAVKWSEALSSFQVMKTFGYGFRQWISKGCPCIVNPFSSLWLPNQLFSSYKPAAKILTSQVCLVNQKEFLLSSIVNQKKCKFTLWPVLIAGDKWESLELPKPIRVVCLKQYRIYGGQKEIITLINGMLEAGVQVQQILLE